MKNKKEVKQENTNILLRHTTEVNGSKQINVVSAMLELDARIKTIVLQIQELQEAMGDCGLLLQQMEERLNKINPKIDVVSVAEANKILKG